MGDHSYKLPTVPGAGPPDVDFVASQANGYEEADCLEPELSRADPAAVAPS